MAMEVIAVCRSKKRMRPKAAAILDRYLFRIGDRTWKGRASTACLKRMSADLKAIASRNLAVAVHRARGSSTLEVPLFVIGSKSRFSPSGVVPISVTKSRSRQQAAGGTDRAEEYLVGLAALMHDVGKCTNAFQAKLKSALLPKTRGKGASAEVATLADAVRHEVFSAFFFDVFCRGLSPDDHKGLATRIESALDRPAEFGDAANEAAKACRRLMKSGDAESPIVFDMDVSDPDAPLPAVLLLILTHHRLVWTDERCREMKARHHVNVEREINRETFSIIPECAIWNDEDWCDSLRRTCRKISCLEAARVVRAELYARTGLMLADHVGSHEKRPGSITSAALANTTTDEDGAKCSADTVSTHTGRVYSASKTAMRMLQGQMNSLPAIDSAACPEDLRDPRPASERFSWQGVAAREAARVAASKPGGFFGCILSGTGTGKTRGAPTILANAVFADSDPDRQDLRFNLALGLRTLAHQSAREYVEALNFRAEDISVLVGGETISWEGGDERGGSATRPEPEETGSEDRLLAVSGTRSERPEADADQDADLSHLGLDCDRDLPAFADRVIEAARDNGTMLRRLLATPIAVATIDHLMPAADARRSWHLPAMLRLASSDMIIDEIDQFSEEDLMAIERLAEIVGAFGRRLIIMSATLPADVASQMHDAFRRGYSDFCRRAGKDDRVHVLLSGDDAQTVSARTDPHFPAFYQSMVSVNCARLREGAPLRRARILDPVSGWDELAAQVFSTAGKFHRQFASNASDEIFVSAGLVRMTRVKHVQNLALALADLGEDDIHREYVVVHSRMPQIQWSWIEHNLRLALTRKGSDPDRGLLSLLEREGVCQRAREAGKHHIALVVISSPVIETGNDVDFDYAIIDPSSLRAIVQTAGRVRRHRSPHETPDNIAIFAEYCVSKFEGSKACKPGVETDPPSSVASVTLDDLAGRDAGTLLGPWEGYPIDAGILIDETRSSPLRHKEEELRGNYRSCRPAVAVRTTGLSRWSARRPVDLRFRRAAAVETTAFPTVSGSGDVAWWEFSGRHNRTRTDAGLLERPHDGHVSAILAEDLVHLLEARHGAIDPGRLMTEGAISFFPSTTVGMSSGVRDTVLGVLSPSA